jgi:hypothetical protein
MTIVVRKLDLGRLLSSRFPDWLRPKGDDRHINTFNILERGSQPSAEAGQTFLSREVR